MCRVAWSSRVRGKEVYGREVQDSTLTAASLIDAIITHQINQPSPNDRSSPAPTNRTGDRLFASFQRSPASQQSGGGHGNPQQNPHNLSIPNQVHGHGPPQHEEKVVVNDGRMNHKMPPARYITGIADVNVGLFKINRRSERVDPPMKSGPSMGPGGVPSFGRREGISLDYFNNLIMEKMRNENNEEMKSEDGHERKHDPNSGPSVPQMNLPGGSASHVHGHNPAAHGHPSHFGGLAGRIAAAARDDMRSNSDSQRGGDGQHFQLKIEKMDDEPSKGGDSDSPASMVIDESADMKDPKSQQSHNDSSATATSQPNYEPLTDEEN
ncbi:hypothetical protein Ocin01_03991 [Orchesella cincta]|uniref:Uncharacterized protein n=1 Tax=Orchesella cincta TaxID=48709 RepID=A0A1D2NBS0_ORCCI|nr:hypothetical protein Ocin01_03991 [Orchesella cincta]